MGHVKNCTPQSNNMRSVITLNVNFLPILLRYCTTVLRVQNIRNVFTKRVRVDKVRTRFKVRSIVPRFGHVHSSTHLTNQSPVAPCIETSKQTTVTA